MDLPKQQLLVALAAAVLSACGGGGGDAGGSAPVPPPPGPATVNVNQAWKNFLGTSGSWLVSGTGSDNKAYSLGIVSTPGTTQIFPISGTTYATTSVAAGVTVNGLNLNQSVSVTYYDAGTFLAAGTRTTENAEPATCSTASASAVPPTSASVGTSGALHTFTDLNGCQASTAAAVGSSVTTWSLESENNITYFCLNTTARDLNGATLFSESDCFQTSADGTLGAKARVTLAQPGFTLTARN